MKYLRIRFSFLLSLLIFVSVNALAIEPIVEENNSQSQNPVFTLGTELDALPFITGGYYFSVIGGYDRFRIRGIVSQVNLPSFAYDSSNFSKSSLHVYAAVVDYFFATDYCGYWIGAGFENWKGTVNGNVAGTSGLFREWVSTLGAGYNWFFYKTFYLDPWAAVHMKFAGDSQAEVGSQLYTVHTLQAEASLKIGWYF